ncbi:MAG: hypothetical protein MJE12_05915 [Alphaproteobacteria bacterium]|nr:hypothetical protein [Alphaproteobacteria bacterium]
MPSEHRIFATVVRSRAVSVFCAVAMIGSCAAVAVNAAAIPARGTGSMANGEDACEKLALRDARVSALTKKIESLSGRFDAARHGKLLPETRRFVSREKIESFRVLNRDFCEVRIRVRFKTSALKEAIKGTAGGARVGAVIRYVVDGRLADDSGINPLEAVRALNSELEKHNCRLVDLLFEQDLFARRMREVEVPLSGDEDAPDKVYQTGLSYAEAVRNVLVGASQELKREIGLGREGFDRVVSGEVSVRQLGKDLDGPNLIAGALISLSMHEVSTKRIITTTRPIPLRAPGVDTVTARNLALAAAIESAVQTLARKTAICSK